MFYRAGAGFQGERRKRVCFGQIVNILTLQEKIRLKNMNLLINISLIAIYLLCTFSSALAQEDTKTRSITSDDFNSQRPASKPQKPNIRRSTYKYVSKNKKVVRRQSVRRQPVKPQPQSNTAKAEKVSEIGVTMWKLRPSRSSDKGYQLPVLINDTKQMWTAERVEIGTLFRSGDRVRIAIESSVSGYLYIVNSELLADGSAGDPFLIFPESESQDNSVKPGMLVDIPDQTEDLPYFLINPKNSNYTGELLTVIISPKPLTSLKVDKDGKIKNLDDLIDLENNTDAEIFSRSDSQDKIYSMTEAQSACGAKTRQLVRERTPEKPCGEKTRQLTREEPLPQTLYRVTTVAGQPIVASIQLTVKP